MTQDPVEKLVEIGFSEYEAKAYVALLQENPITGYQLAKLSGVPRSMIYEVLGKLTTRGAAMTLHKETGTKYAPVPAHEFLDQLHHDHEVLVVSLKDDLGSMDRLSDLEYVWNIEGHENIMAKVLEMIAQAECRIYVSLLPATFAALQEALQEAIDRDVQVVVYSTGELDLMGGRMIAAPAPEEAEERIEGLWLVLVVDGKEVLIGELLTENRARASWTGSPLFVFVAEHHLRTDLYLPRVLAMLGDQGRDLIREEDRELFACAFESHLDC